MDSQNSFETGKRSGREEKSRTPHLAYNDRSMDTICTNYGHSAPAPNPHHRHTIVLDGRVRALLSVDIAAVEAIKDLSKLVLYGPITAHESHLWPKMESLEA